MSTSTGVRSLRPLLLAGDLLADRYRLVRPVEPSTPEEGGPTLLWLAQDEVLARPVAAKVLAVVGRRGTASSRVFLEAAAAAGAVSHPVLARVYDAALEQRPAERAGRPAGEVDVAYVISEWVEGATLAADLAKDGPWEPDEAVALVTEVADALAVAHAAGLVHGRVHPGNVLIPRGGGVKLTDLAVSVVLPDRAVPALRATDPAGPAADIRDLAAVLYALLTARWPTSATPQPSGGLPAAPTGRDERARGKLISPGQVLAGVPRALDTTIVRALDPTRSRNVPDLTSAAGFCDALDKTIRPPAPVRPAAPAGPTAPRQASPASTSTARLGGVPPDRRVAPSENPVFPPEVVRFLPLVGVLVLLFVIGLVSYNTGRSIGEIPLTAEQRAEQERGRDRPSSGGAGPGSGPLAGTLIKLAEVPIIDFDPPPGDGRERPGSVPNAHDEDLSTVWETERYDSDTFGGIKSGVGLLVDFGAPTPVSRVELDMAVAGTTVELRAADAAAPDISNYRVLARGRSAADQLALTPAGGTSARYYLVWITGLPKVGGDFTAGIKEMRFLRG
ncbi:MAG: hypothetical protein M4D85_10220 [Actinomycetota bacterium]|nr:hypothetical protein [Actinomycetota bacterium]